MTGLRQPHRLWGTKPYHSLDFHLRERFGEKVYRLSLNGGLSCPNRDGSLDHRGCIFCSSGGSGDFAAPARLSIPEQLALQKRQVKEKTGCHRFIAYFQAYTNTYGPVSYLEQIYTEAIRPDDIAALSIATRPDCLPPEVLSLLARINDKKPVWVELGLQTIWEDTARFIRRGFPLSCFEQAVSNLRSLGLPVIVHVILGLPGEDVAQMLDTVSYLGRLGIDGIKLQLLHVLRDTDLAEAYRNRPFPMFSLEEYAQLLVSCLERLPQQTVIHRLTGDGPGDLLIAPQWSRRKKSVLNRIHAIMREQGAYQGRLFDPA